MNQTIGYIYIRNHFSYNIDNVYKLGKTINIPERDTLYATGEVKRGYFETVFEVPFKQLNIIERLLQYELKEYNIKYDAGTEFYDTIIINFIEPFFMKMNIQYKKLTNEEINNLLRIYIIKNIFKKINKKNLIHYLKSFHKKIIYKPRQEQLEIINKSYEYFLKFNKGILVLMCGVGKTLISLWLSQKLNSNSIIIGVPNILLLHQWEDKIKILFPYFKILIISNGITTKYIEDFLKNNKKCILITTYSSSHKVYKASQNINFTFDMKINDECHHLTSTNILDKDKKNYINILKINSKKQLSLTATLKILENNVKNSDEDIIISNDNIQYFGQIIDRKSLLWTINKNIICDYIIQNIITDEKEFEQYLIRFNISNNNDKRLFLSAFCSLKSIINGESHHLLIYCNNKENSLKLIQYITILLHNYFNIDENDLYYFNYHSNMSTYQQKNIINNFENFKFGIISCVYCLGEGWDLPLLDGVVFSENMSSNIRIIQSALRPNRKNNNESNKISKIILPILNINDFMEDNENNDLKKVKQIIYQMSLEDETINQKIKLFKININNDDKNTSKQVNKKENNINICNDLLDKILLKTTKRMQLNITYEKAKSIISTKNILSKKSYYEYCDIDCRLSKEPEILFKGKFTNWIDYLNIKRIYYDLKTCKEKVNEYLKLNPEFKKEYLDLSNICYELCQLDSLFPPCELWCEYYDVNDLKNIIIINNKKKISYKK